MARILCESLLRKIDEQIERTLHLAALLPREAAELSLDASNGWTAADLLGHLLDCLAGFCAALYAAAPEKLAHFEKLRELPVNQPIARLEFGERLRVYGAHLVEGFAAIDDAALATLIPTVFVPAGQTLLTLLLGNLEHLINHKHQLFELLKRSGVKVDTADLYVLQRIP